MLKGEMTLNDPGHVRKEKMKVLSEIFLKIHHQK